MPDPAHGDEVAQTLGWNMTPLTWLAAFACLCTSSIAAAQQQPGVVELDSGNPIALK